MQKKIIIISYNGASNAGGVERVVYYLREILLTKVEVLVLDKQQLCKIRTFSWLDKCLPNRIFRIITPILNAVYLYWYKKAGDIIISNSYQVVLFPVDYLIIHGSMKGLFNAIYPNKKYSVTMFYECLAGQCAKKLIAVSESAKQQWQIYYKLSRKPFFVLNNCVDSSKFYPKPKKHGSKINVLFVGRLDKTKNPEKILELANYIEQTEDMNLNLITNNAFGAENFQHLTKTQVQIGLDIEQIKGEYSKNDVFFFPSRYEGFEMVTLEALSSGIPVVGSNVGAISELVGQKFPGVYLLNDVNYLQQLREVANEYFPDSKRMMLHNAVAEKFSIQEYAKKLNEIIVLNEKDYLDE